MVILKTNVSPDFYEEKCNMVIKDYTLFCFYFALVSGEKLRIRNLPVAKFWAFEIIALKLL